MNRDYEKAARAYMKRINENERLRQELDDGKDAGLFEDIYPDPAIAYKHHLRMVMLGKKKGALDEQEGVG